MPQRVEPSSLSSANKVESGRTEKRLDDFLLCGRYAALIGILHEFLAFTQLSAMFFMMFGGADVVIESCGDVSLANLTERTKCARIGSLVNDTGCKPGLSAQFESINYEFGYFCDGTRQIKQSISIQMIGVIVGSLGFGQISDICGRKICLVVTIIGCIICTLVSSYSSSLSWFTLWRFALNVFVGGNTAVLHVFMVENLPKKHRFWITSIVGWSINMIFFVLLAMLVREWRALVRCVTLLSLPGFLCTLLLHESPRFLVQKRRSAEAKSVIRSIHRFDGRTLDENELDRVIQAETAIVVASEQSHKRYSLIHLIYSPKLTAYTMAVGFALFTASCLNYSLIFNIGKLSGSIYLNALYTSLGRYAVNLFAIFLDIRFAAMGRKAIHAIGEGVILVVFAAYLGCKFMGWDSSTARSFYAACVMGIICMSTTLFITGHLLSSELFPTGIRNVSFGAGQLCSRCGVVLSPQFFVLADLHPQLPYVTLCAITALDFGLFYVALDETKGRALVDHMPPHYESWLSILRKAGEAGAPTTTTPSTRATLPSQG